MHLDNRCLPFVSADSGCQPFHSFPVRGSVGRGDNLRYARQACRSAGACARHRLKLARILGWQAGEIQKQPGWRRQFSLYSHYVYVIPITHIVVNGINQLSDTQKQKARRFAEPRAFWTCERALVYFDTAANRSDFISAWNCLSSVLK